MGIVYAKAEASHKYSFGEDEASLVEYDEDLGLGFASTPTATYSLNGIKARVDRVNVDGLERTKDDIIKDTVDDMFKAEDFEDVIVRAHKVRQALDNLGCFRNICVFIDVSTGPDATPDGLEVTFQVRELSRLMAGINTTVDDDESSLVFGMKLPNMWGRGERAQAAYSLGYWKTFHFNLTATKPLFHQPMSPVLKASVFQQNQQYPWAGYRMLQRGMQFGVDFSTSPTTKHHVEWEGLIREVRALSNTTFKIREDSGPQLKSCIRHTVTVEHRDQVVFPTRGAYLQLSTELAGLGGGVAHMRTEFRAQANHTVHEDVGIVVQATGAVGVLHNLYGSILPDHFFLGGPTTVRGFQQRGVGPHGDGQALGGRVYWAGGVHLYTPLPLPGARTGFANMFRSHAFLNAGCLAVPERREVASWGTLKALSAARVAIGAGVCARLGRSTRLEVNYVYPLLSEPLDRPLTGLQFGIGANFL